MFSLIGAGIAGGVLASATSAGINAAVNNNNNATNEYLMREQFKLNSQAQVAQNQFQALMARQNQGWQEKLINEERAYEDPSAQVQRFLDAGINPLSAMSSGGVSSGAALQTSPAQVPSVGSGASASLAQTHPFQINGLTEAISEGMKQFLQAKQVQINEKRADAQNKLDFENIEKVKADTQAIKDGNVRANELFSFQLVEAQKNLEKIGVDTDLGRATIQNIKVRSEYMLVQSQEVYAKLLQEGLRLEQQRFGQEVQAKGLQVQAQIAQANVAKMSLDGLISYCNSFGKLKSTTSGVSTSAGKSHTSGAVGSLSAGAESPSLVKPIGKVSGSAGLELSSSDSNSESKGFSSGFSSVYREIREETLQPMQAAMRLLQEIQNNPTDVRLGRALQNVNHFLNSSYLNMFNNFLMLQGQIRSIAPSVVNPSGTDTYGQ